MTANLCVTGPEEYIMKLDEKMEMIEECQEKTLIEDLVRILGGKSNTYSGEWIDRTLGDNNLYITLEAEWDKIVSFSKFIESRYKGLKVFYYIEEPQLGIYRTNDREGIFFGFRYILESCQNTEYFKTIEEIVRFVEMITGMNIEEKTEKVLDEILAISIGKEKQTYSFHKFEFCN